MTTPPAVDRRPHRGEAEDAGAAAEAHQEGLGVIVAVWAVRRWLAPAARAASISRR